MGNLEYAACGPSLTLLIYGVLDAIVLKTPDVAPAMLLTVPVWDCNSLCITGNIQESIHVVSQYNLAGVHTGTTHHALYQYNTIAKTHLENDMMKYIPRSIYSKLMLSGYIWIIHECQWWNTSI